MSIADRLLRTRGAALAASLVVHGGLLAMMLLAFAVGQPPAGPRQVVPAIVTVPVAPADPVPREAAKAVRAVASQPPVEQVPAPASPVPAMPASSEAAAMPAPVAPPRPLQTEAPPVPAAQPSIAPADALASYTALLRAAILTRKPPGLSGTGIVTVFFRTARSGALLESEVAVSSGDLRLDRAALRMVRQAAPFPPPDKAIAEAQLAFSLPIRFR